MEGRTDLDLALAQERIEERLNEARHDRLARVVRSHATGRIRRWLGHALVDAGRTLARDGLVEGTGEPIADATSTVMARRASAEAAPSADAPAATARGAEVCTAACSELEPAA